MQVQLDKDHWADILELADLRDGHRKAVNRAIRIEVDDGQRPVIKGSMQDDMRDALLAEIVTNWSLPYPLPSRDPRALDNLTIEQGRALHAAIKPYMELIKGDEEPVRENPVPTEGSGS